MSFKTLTPFLTQVLTLNIYSVRLEISDIRICVYVQCSIKFKNLFFTKIYSIGNMFDITALMLVDGVV